MNSPIVKLCLSVFILFGIIQENGLVNPTSASVARKDITFSSSEVFALNQMKPRVLPLLKKEYMKSDFYLIRWLRTRNLNVAQAETALVQHLRWRQQNNIDSILNENFSDMETDFPYEISGQDLQGQPVYTVDVYLWDLRRVILEGKSQRLMRYLFRLMEDAIEKIFLAQQNGKNVTRFVVLGNADGFNLAQHACTICLPVWVQFVRTFETQYPNFVDEVIVIEAPGTVNVVLDLIRPLLSAEMNNAIKIFGHNREKWMAYLNNKIAPNQRTEQYGGTKQD